MPRMNSCCCRNEEKRPLPHPIEARRPSPVLSSSRPPADDPSSDPPQAVPFAKPSVRTPSSVSSSSHGSSSSSPSSTPPPPSAPTFHIFGSNSLCAFALNLAVFLLVSKTSALIMNVAGVVKDWLLIELAGTEPLPPPPSLGPLGPAPWMGVPETMKEELAALEASASPSSDDLAAHPPHPCQTHHDPFHRRAFIPQRISRLGVSHPVLRQSATGHRPPPLLSGAWRPNDPLSAPVARLGRSHGRRPQRPPPVPLFPLPISRRITALPSPEPEKIAGLSKLDVFPCS